jgi:uncharacterized protein
VTQPLTPRRKDRTVTDEAWMKRFLREEPVGVLAVLEDDRPYQNPNLFVYDEARHAVYVHGSSSGRLPALTTTKRQGSFTVFRLGRILPADRAFSFSAEYASLIAFGEVERVRDVQETTHVLKSFMAKYAPHLTYDVDYEGVRPRDLPLTAVHRLEVAAWSAKQNPEVPAGQPAYPYPRR